MSTDAVLVDGIGDDLARITLNRPDRLNAIDDSFIAGLHAVRLTKEMLRTSATAPSLREAALLENRTQVLAVYAGDIDRASDRFRHVGAPAVSGPIEETGRGLR